jgi:hypothetical protein
VAQVASNELAELSNEICNRSYRDALPAALSERWLKPIARDLRQFEMSMGLPDEDATNSSLSAPALLAIHIMTGRLRERQIETPIVFSVEGFQRWIQVYQYAVEREVVARYTGIRFAGDEETLLAALDLQIDSLADR